MLVHLSPRRLLGHPLQAAPRAAAFELRPVDAGHGGQGGDVEDVADAVLRVPGGALGVGHGADLPRQVSALKMRKERENISLFGGGINSEKRFAKCEH